MSRRDRDRGLSLIEVLVVVVVLGVVMTVISGVVAVILRTQGPLAAATDDSRSLRGAVTWLAQDVAGVPPTGFDFSPAASSGCGGDVGPSLVRLAWSETSTTTVNYVANYRFVDDGPTKVVRIWSRIGARPIFAGGNANGDLQMLKIATWNAPASMALVVDHDDGEREPKYTSGAEILMRAAKDNGWTVASVKNDWNTVFND